MVSWFLQTDFFLNVRGIICFVLWIKHIFSYLIHARSSYVSMYVAQRAYIFYSIINLKFLLSKIEMPFLQHPFNALEGMLV